MSTDARHLAERTLRLKLPDRYTIRRHIASGGMASVWCAEDRLLGRTVAIKVLSERFSDDQQAIRRFKREARAAARVSAHPYVVTIFDVGDIEPRAYEDRPSAFIVMEYLAGGTVADASRCDSVTRDEARRWLRQAASALDHAHERGVVHRDIKPGNFLLDRERNLHVADFGIARLQSEDTITSSGELFGTAAYLAPEQALGRDATSASDRYSLAVAAFELLTRGRPFTAPHFAAQARQHIEQEPPRASERDRTLPAAVDRVLRRGMAKDPAARYATATMFVDALNGALDSDRTAATRPLRKLRGGRAAALVSPARPARATTAGRTAATTPLQAAGSRHNGQIGRMAALAALAVVALGVIVLITQLHSGSEPSSAGSTRHAAVKQSTRTHKKSATHTQTAASVSASTSASSTASSSATAPASAAAIQLQGHDQMLAGSYGAAISTLHRALDATAPGSLVYAYALYDLGRSLLLAGDPKAAVPVLEQRLKIPNQTAVVQQTLDQALAAAGEAPRQPAPAGGPPGGPRNGNGHGGGPGPGDGHRKGNGNGRGGGAGLGNDDGGNSANVGAG